MPYEITLYHCSTCRTPYPKHAQALTCERQNHNARTVLPAAKDLAKSRATLQGARDDD